jgi:hypothetical protein
VAQEEDFQVAVIDENAHYVRSFDKLVSRITNCLPRYASHPGYLKIKGQPVWFIYQVWDDWLTPVQAAQYIDSAEKAVGDIFWMFDRLRTTATLQPPGAHFYVQNEWLNLSKIDCFGTYSYFGHWRDVDAGTISSLYTNFTQQMRAAGKWAQLPAVPGHDNTAVSDEPCPIPRKNGELLKSFLRGIDAAKPEIAVICSWNEWLESTEIEPAANWADPYLYLKIVAEWRGKKFVTPPLPKK